MRTYTLAASGGKSLTTSGGQYMNGSGRYLFGTFSAEISCPYSGGVVEVIGVVGTS